MRRALSVLAPLGWLYGFGTSVRRAAYARGLLRAERLRSPVISVGGLSMGGSMKTPAVIELARALAARGPAVGVIGHGYRARDARARLVSDGTQPLESASTAGDEAMVVAHELPGSPVAIGRSKAAAGRLLEERFGKRILLVDSGFQHLALHRDLDIVCVSEDDLASRVLPAGLLREPARALARAHIIFTDRETDGPRVARLRAERPRDVFSVARADFGFYPAEGDPAEAPAPASAFVFCAVGRPERVVSDIAARGVTIAGHRFFRDHHAFTEAELREVADAAVKSGAAAVVTTVKDAVRIQAWPGPTPLQIVAARLDIERLPEVLKRIDGVILARIKAGL